MLLCLFFFVFLSAFQLFGTLTTHFARLFVHASACVCVSLWACVHVCASEFGVLVINIFECGWGWWEPSGPFWWEPCELKTDNTSRTQDKCLLHNTHYCANGCRTNAHARARARTHAAKYSAGIKIMQLALIDDVLVTEFCPVFPQRFSPDVLPSLITEITKRWKTAYDCTNYGCN